MKTKFEKLSERAVAIEYDDDWGCRLKNIFSAPRGGGYVRDCLNRQICKRLASTGATLLWVPERDGPLIDLIRREHRRGSQYKRRQESR